VEAAGIEAPQSEPARMRVLPGDRFLILDGQYAGMKGSFVREGDRVAAIDLGRVAPGRE
jgi:hypothetical protein